MNEKISVFVNITEQRGPHTWENNDKTYMYTQVYAT